MTILEKLGIIKTDSGGYGFKPPEIKDYPVIFEGNHYRVKDIDPETNRPHPRARSFEEEDEDVNEYSCMLDSEAVGRLIEKGKL